MYHALITQIKQLSPKQREDLRQLYKKLLATEDIIHKNQFSTFMTTFPYVITEGNNIVSVFGLDRRPCSHQLTVNGKTLFCWCIWDAFFIAESITEKAEIKTCDPISGKVITVFWENRKWHGKAEFSCSFPVANAQSQCSLRSVFCRYVHLFESQVQGRIYQQKADVEIISWEKLLERSTEMAKAITSRESFPEMQGKILENLCC